MDDLISRQAAIDALATMYCKSDEDGYVWIIRRDAWARIDALPPAEPKMGKWIYKNDLITVPGGYWECSECKEGRLLYEANFCPNCGADMRGKQNDSV